MADQCPHCGAIYTEGYTCQAIFESLITLEYSNPDYGEVHFLTVACYMIQHGFYSDEALAWIVQMLEKYLESGVPVQHIRRVAARSTDQQHRIWRITRAPGDQKQQLIKWSITIQDVATKVQDAASYCESVKRWAACTLQEMKPLLTNL